VCREGSPLQGGEPSPGRGSPLQGGGALSREGEPSPGRGALLPYVTVLDTVTYRQVNNSITPLISGRAVCCRPGLPAAPLHVSALSGGPAAAGGRSGARTPSAPLPISLHSVLWSAVGASPDISPTNRADRQALNGPPCPGLRRAGACPTQGSICIMGGTLAMDSPARQRRAGGEGRDILRFEIPPR
jgi:hypothetical protein